MTVGGELPNLLRRRAICFVFPDEGVRQRSGTGEPLDFNLQLKESECLLGSGSWSPLCMV